MKKILVLVVSLLFAFNFVEAKDYVKTQIKEMKHAQKYATTKKVTQNITQNYNAANAVQQEIKDPHIMKFGDYQKISKSAYDEKLKKDENEYKEYATLLGKKHSSRYTTQADAEDFYQVYRVAEKLIRANKLDYMNWRICLKKSAEEVNAYNDGSNLVVITTSLFDTFNNNEDALAMIIGHEMGHALLGHYKRRNQLLVRMNKQYKKAKGGNAVSAVAYKAMERKFIIDSKNMEYAADVEGAKLALHAGYNLTPGADVLTFLMQYDLDRDYNNDHPNSDKRLENLSENSKYFLSEWKEIGEYNIYNSEVLPVKLSSDRKSIVISAPQNKLNPNKYYAPETMNELYSRLGYMYYKNGQFEKSLQYFNDLFKIDQTNAPAYLYASYASEYLYQNTSDDKYLSQAKEYAQKAYLLDSKNKYIKEQVDSL